MGASTPGYPGLGGWVGKGGMVWSGGWVGRGGGQLGGTAPPPTGEGAASSTSGGTAAVGLAGCEVVQHTPNF